MCHPTSDPEGELSTQRISDLAGAPLTYNITPMMIPCRENPRTPRRGRRSASNLLATGRHAEWRVDQHAIYIYMAYTGRLIASLHSHQSQLDCLLSPRPNTRCITRSTSHPKMILPATPAHVGMLECEHHFTHACMEGYDVLTHPGYLYLSNSLSILATSLAYTLARDDDKDKKRS